MNALIIEDEDNSRSVLTTLIDQYCPQVQILGYASDAREAVEKIRSIKPNLVFMDIELPYGNAFDILSKLKEINFHIVFTTAYDSYAIRAIKTGAIDYLLKPIDYNELKNAIQKIEANIEEKQKNINIEQLINVFSKHIYVNNLALPTMDGFSFIKFEEIIRIAADGNYCKIFCMNNRVYTITKQIHEIEGKLPPEAFFRIHNSHIINLMHVKEYVKGRGGYVVMVDGSNVDVSFRRKDDFLDRLS